MSIWVLPDEGLYECSLGRCHGMLRGPYGDDDETLAAARLHLASAHGEETRGAAKQSAQMATGMRCDECAADYKVKGSGLCAGCKRKAATDRARARRAAEASACAAEGCARMARAKGLCISHYNAAWTLTTTAPIEHGTANAYRNRACRCATCVSAESVRRAARKAGAA